MSEFMDAMNFRHACKRFKADEKIPSGWNRAFGYRLNPQSDRKRLAREEIVTYL